MQNFKVLLSEKNQSFRYNIRRIQNEHDFQSKRNHFSSISLNEVKNYSQFSDFHREWKENKEVFNLKGNISQLREHVISKNFILNFKEISETNIIEDLLEILNLYKHDFIVISDVFWILGQFCSGESAFSQYLSSLETFNIFEKSMELIKFFLEIDEALVMIFFTLGNIIGSIKTQRKKIIKLGILELIIEIFKTKHSITLVQEITWFLSVLLYPKPSLPLKKIETIFPVLAHTLFLEDCETISYTLWAIMPFYTWCDFKFILTSSFVMEKILLLFKERKDDYNILVPAIELIGNILSGEDELAKFLLQKGVLSILSTFFDVECLKSRICWCLGNLLSCKDGTVLHKTVQNELFIKGIECLVNGKTNEKKEILYGLVESFDNMRIEYLRYLFSIGLNNALEAGLKNEESKIQILTLKAIFKLGKIGQNIYSEEGNEMIARIESGSFDFGDFLERIYNNHKDPNVIKKTVKILETFYIF